MCLSTAYAKKEGEKVICEYVSALSMDGPNITLTDVLGGTTNVRGILKTADLARGILVIDTEET